METFDRELTEEVGSLARKLGAEMVGVGNVERWREAPPMLSPQGLLPTARSVVVCGVIFLDASMELAEREISEHWYNTYDNCEELTGMNDRLDSIAFRIARLLEARGYRSLPTPVTGLWRIRPYKSIEHPFAPALVNRYAAVAAGLGEIGWNGLFLSPEYGPRQRLVPVVTEAPLEPTPMYDGPRLCDRCMTCVKKCPLDCFRKEVSGLNKIDIGGKGFEFPAINKWRCYLDYYNIFGPFLPAVTTERTAIAVAHGERKPQQPIMDTGACLCSCVPPQLRFQDEKYPGAWRRKKNIKTADPGEVSGRLKSMVLERGVDYLGIGTELQFSEKGIRLEEHLPEASSVVVLGIRYSNDFMKLASQQRLQKTLFDVSHYLQALGYPTLPVPRISAGSIAKVFRFEEKNTHFLHLITALPLNSLRMSPVNWIARRKTITSKDVKSFALEYGVDLVGISSVKRLEKIYPSIKSLYGTEQTIQIHAERTGGPTQVLKRVSIDGIRLRKPKDLLANGTSVIVIGLHYPAAVIETVAKPPAESFASYTRFACRTVMNELNAAAFDIVKFLNRAGYAAEPALDVLGTASIRRSERGFAISVTDSRFDAVCAGLGDIGWNGAVLTPKYGLQQRFVSILTDAVLEEDSVYEGPALCTRCFKCVEACPTNALSRKRKVRLKIENRVFEFGRLDRLRCDWSKWCALVGEEGPTYLGLTTNVLPPKTITAEAVHDALNQLNPVEQSWGTTFELCYSVCGRQTAGIEKTGT
jgi:epoxyqueuosine reductase QueG